MRHEAADLVLKNGNIYTVSEREPWVQAVALEGDTIRFVGSNADVQAYEGGNTRVIDLRGVTVVPGMTDCHYHLSGVGEREMTLNLEGTTRLEEFLARVKARADQTKPGEWVTGGGWLETFWESPVFPTRRDLDKVSPSTPVFLCRAQELSSSLAGGARADRSPERHSALR